MALSTLTPTQIAAGSSAASAVTVTITLTDAVPVGQTVLVWGGFQLTARTLTSVADSKGNVYTVDAAIASVSGANSSGIARSVVTAALAIADTITLTFNGVASTAVKTGYAAKVPARLGVVSTGTTGNGTPANPAAWGGAAGAVATTSDDCLIFGGSQSSSAAVTSTPTGANVELYDVAGAAVEYQLLNAKTTSVAATGSWSGASSSHADVTVAYTPLPSLAAGSWTTSDLASGASHSHAGPADVKGVVVLIEHDTVSTDAVSAVTYGGVAMQRLVTAADVTEAGRVYIYWLDEAAPDGTQNVVVTHSTSTVRIAVASMTCTPGRYIRYDNSGSAVASGSTNPALNVTTTQGGIGVQVIHWGLDTMVTTMRSPFVPIVAGVLGTGSHYDAGTYGAGFGTGYFSTPGSLLSGWTSATAEDYALAAAYFYETDIDVGQATEADRAVMFPKPVFRATETDTAGSMNPAPGLLPPRAYVPAGADGIGTAATYTSATASVDAPDNIEVGDTLLAFMAYRGVVSAPAGWTALVTVTDPTAIPAYSASVWRRVAVLADVGTASYTLNGNAGGFQTEAVIVKVRDGDTAQAYDATGTSGANISPTQTSLTTLRSGLYFGMWGPELNAGQTTPVGMTTIRNSAATSDSTETLAAYKRITNGETFAPSPAGGNIFGGRIRFVIADKARVGQATETDTASHLARPFIRASDTETAGAIAALGGSNLTAPVALFHTEETLKTTDSTLTVPTDVPAGSTVVLTIGHAIGASTVKKVTDNSGNSYRWRVVRAGPVQSSGAPPQVEMVYVWCPSGLASGTTITVQFSSAASMTRIFHCCYMIGQARPDKSATFSTTAATWSVATTDNTAFGNEVAIAACAMGANTTSTDTSAPAMTELYDSGATNATSGDRALVTQYRTGVLSGATVTASGAFAGGSSRRYNALVVTFRAYLGGNSYATEVNADSPTNWWHLDDTSGTTAVDDPGTADGTYVNTPSLNQTGAFGASGASVLHSAASQEDTTLPFSVGVSVDVTIEAWVKSPAALVTAALRDNTAASGWIVLLQSSGAEYTSRLANSSLTWALGHLDDADWHHVVITRSGTDGAVYIDGQQVASGTVGTGAFVSPLHLARNGTNSNWEDISVDEVARYTTALSWDRIRAHFDAAVSSQIARTGRAVETDTAGTMTLADTITVTAAQATETDTASRLATEVRRASETDTARTVSTSQRISVGQATETDTAQTVVRTTVVARASETDTSQPLTRRVGRASETDSARALARRISVGRVVETDTARAIQDVYAIGRATETDTARPITAVWFPLVDQAEEADTAGTVARLLITAAEEADSAGTWARLLVNQALETDTAQTVLPTLTLHPEFIELDPALDSTVFEPTLIEHQNLEPEPFAPPAATIFEPALDAGQPLEPDTLTGALTPTVYDPTLIGGQFLEPDTLIGGLTPTVFSPALIPGQFLEPDTLTGGLSPIVPSPALIRGQLINPDTLTGGLSPTVYDPELAHGQPIYPDELDPALSITVYEPALANTQQLVVGDPYVNPEPTVFDPALAQRQPSVIVVGEANQITRSVLREAR